MKLFAIVRDINGDFYGGILKGTLKVYSGNGADDLVPESLSFDVYRKVNKKKDVPHADKFMTINEFRQKCNGRLPVKFSQIILDNLGFDRVWIFDNSGNKL